MEPQKKLSVSGLTVSFRTADGKVQAVRGIDFDLHKGETLAIVGESGSGKSVTSKAILGILAGNSIIEGGEIIYDGKDLLKIKEDEFHKIRGDKIAMIFQDPMSSLNPIVRVGKQLTEAMLLKGKARQKESRNAFNSTLALLNKKMIEALARDDATHAEKLTGKCRNFDKFEYKHLDLERRYLAAYEAANDASFDLSNLIFEIGKNAARDLHYRLARDMSLAGKSIETYVVKNRAAELTELIKEAKTAVRAYDKDASDTRLGEVLTGVKEILDEALAFEKPNFFAMGYHECFVTEPLPDLPVPELNKYLRKYLDDNFMLDFIADAKEGILYSAKESAEKKKQVISMLRQEKAVFEAQPLDRKACFAAAGRLSRAVLGSVDHLELEKDNLAYTFPGALRSEIMHYFDAIGENAKEEKRFARQSAKWERKAAKGKEPDWKVVPASTADLELIRKGILHQIDRLAGHYEDELAGFNSRNFDDETVAMIDFLKAKASGVVDRVTKSMAKNKALKLMEEVGIPEPRKRYRQYPFEFSGGMRQRIVIAIALAANPDILICDEPTTALDVTIQAQILELINRFKKERNLSVIFITHDLGVVANMADRVAVMYAGKIVEYGTSEDIFYRAAHPYTWALLSSMPDLDTDEKLEAIPGTPPNMIYPPVGDAFAARNKYALKIDFERQPPMFRISDTHFAATWLLHPDAPKIDPPKIMTERIRRMRERGGNVHAE